MVCFLIRTQTTKSSQRAAKKPAAFTLANVIFSVVLKSSGVGYLGVSLGVGYFSWLF